MRRLANRTRVLPSSEKGMENVKTSGSDGFKCEFYKFFRGDIKQHVITSKIIALKKYVNYQRRGIITLVPRKDK